MKVAGELLEICIGVQQLLLLLLSLSVYSAPNLTLFLLCLGCYLCRWTYSAEFMRHTWYHPPEQIKNLNFGLGIHIINWLAKATYFLFFLSFVCTMAHSCFFVVYVYKMQNSVASQHWKPLLLPGRHLLPLSMCFASSWKREKWYQRQNFG